MQDERLCTITGAGAVRRIELKNIVDVPITSVWQAITSSKEVARWWAGGTLENHTGGRVVLGDNAEVSGTVMVFSPPYQFAFTWHDAPETSTRPDLVEPCTRSLVHFDLVEETDVTTRLTMTQYVPAKEALAAAAGWHHIAGERLRSYLETGSVPEDDSRFQQLKAIYQPLDRS